MCLLNHKYEKHYGINNFKNKTIEHFSSRKPFQTRYNLIRPILESGFQNTNIKGQTKSKYSLNTFLIKTKVAHFMINEAKQLPA